MKIGQMQDKTPFNQDVTEAGQDTQSTQKKKSESNLASKSGDSQEKTSKQQSFEEDKYFNTEGKHFFTTLFNAL